MIRVPRQVRRLSDERHGSPENPPEPLTRFRDLPAWVLLGEPGAGKTTAFQQEAEATGGKFLRVADFIADDPDEGLRGKTLFLDGLDEIRARAGASATVIQSIRGRLKRLGKPPFRIACRAADWYGSSDAEDLKGASADGEILRLQLIPLGEDDIRAILRDNHGQSDPQGFIEQARRRGVDGLLDNPQTLGLLAEAVSDGHWPETRHETYQLACQKLAEEANRRHRDQTRAEPCPVDALLEAAGQLCAVLLLSGQTGIALDRGAATPRFADLEACAPPDPAMAAQAVRRKLFRPDGEEFMVPGHRSLAEYLAARWLARQIDAGLPLRRVLNLLLGQDGRTVAGLRGLYAWLAFHSLRARPRLIEADPLTLVIYGDAKPMRVPEKRALLEGLRREARSHPGFPRDVWHSHSLGALADAGLRDDFLAALQAPERDESSQAFVASILEILAGGESMEGLAQTLEEIVRDPTRWPVVRRGALAVWLGLLPNPQTAQALLNDIRERRVNDDEDELAGLLLHYLYPRFIGPEELLRYLHWPSDNYHFGRYRRFWAEELPRIAPDEHLPLLLKALEGRVEVQQDATYDRPLNPMVDGLLEHAIQVFGDDVPDEVLFQWLGVGATEYGKIEREQKARQFIVDWLEERPGRHKALMALCFDRCRGHAWYCIEVQATRLLGAEMPEDMGLWHLEMALTERDEDLARSHLGRAVAALIEQRGAAGLSLEGLEAWAAADPVRQAWLAPLLVREIPDWRIEEAEIKRNREISRAEARLNRRAALTPHLSALQAGTARADLMHQLAGVWMNRFFDTAGDTPLARFEAYCEGGREILVIAEAGFRRCPERSDLPAVEEIAGLALRKQEHLIRLPCLVGMELRWREGLPEVESLPEETLRRMIAFRLTHGADEAPEWFTYLVKQRPQWVADVLVTYASATLRTPIDYVDSIYPLEHDPDYREVAVLAVPRLLEAFPARVRAGQLSYLDNLLKAGMRYTPEQLLGLLAKKCAMKGMDNAQRTYWLATGMLIDPVRYEQPLWKHVGKSEIRANQLAHFLGVGLKGSKEDWPLSIGTVGRLIERISPHAEIERPRGVYSVTAARGRGDQVRSLIARLGNWATDEAKQEIERLLALPGLGKLKGLLETARHELRQRRRENRFLFLSPREVAQVLANQAPASAADLAALALDLIDEIAVEIRCDNDDGFRAFWNIQDKKPTGPREENYCRDTLLPRFRARLYPLDIGCQPERDQANDKRADLCLSYLARYELPIEIKRDSNRDLWKGLRAQLIDQYAISPRAEGYGIYLVLWFGAGSVANLKDGGKRPRTPEELRTRLEAQLDPLEQQRIFVRVLDVSWPR